MNKTFPLKYLMLALVPAVFLGFGSSAWAGIAGSDHDLTTTVTGSQGQICIFCHTPHTTSALSPAAPLWNRQNSGLTFTMYNSTVSPTIDMTVASTPQGVSMGCLSCHDGATAYNSLINSGGLSLGPGTMSGGHAVGSGGILTNDHPISVTYDPTKDPDFVALATVQASANVRLYGASENQVECGSCHDPHKAGAGTPGDFLRVANTNSQICTSCHNK